MWQEPDAHMWLWSLKWLVHWSRTWGFTQTPHETPWHPQQPHPPLPDCVSFSWFHKQQPAAGFCSSNSSVPGDCPGPQTQGIGNTCLSSWSSVRSPQLSVKANAEYFYCQQAQSPPSASQLLGNPECFLEHASRQGWTGTWIFALHLVLVTWFCWYHKVASPLIKQNNSLSCSKIAPASVLILSLPSQGAADLALHAKLLLISSSNTSQLSLDSFPLANRHMWHKPQLQLPPVRTPQPWLPDTATPLRSHPVQPHLQNVTRRGQVVLKHLWWGFGFCQPWKGELL